MKWIISAILVLVVGLGASRLVPPVYAQQTEENTEQQEESSDSTDDNFVPTETINVDTEISFPVDI